MSLTADGNLACCVCGKETELDDVAWEVFTDAGEYDATGGWYLHLHDYTGTTIPKDVVYGFCPEHAPDKPFPTRDENPQFDIDIEIERLKDDAS